jgi:hypothetical protein
LGTSSFDFGWDHFGLNEANDCSAGVTLRFFVISPFTGDFDYRLNVAAADYAGSCACACESTQVLILYAFEEAVVGTTPNGFVVVWWRAGLCLCQGSALRTENTAGGRFIARFNFINDPRQNWNTKATGSRSSTQRLSYALHASVLSIARAPEHFFFRCGFPARVGYKGGENISGPEKYKIFFWAGKSMSKTFYTKIEGQKTFFLSFFSLDLLLRCLPFLCTRSSKSQKSHTKKGRFFLGFFFALSRVSQYALHPPPPQVGTSLFFFFFLWRPLLANASRPPTACGLDHRPQTTDHRALSTKD